MSGYENNAWRRMTMILLSAIISTSLGIMVHYRNLMDIGYIVIAAAIAFIFIYFFLQQMWTLIVDAAQSFIRLVELTSTDTLIGTTIGLLVGVILGILSGIPFYQVPIFGSYLSVIIFFVFSYIGLRIGHSRAGDLLRSSFFSRKNREDGKKTKGKNPMRKVVDTSAIIDGRLYDVAKSHFLEGTFIIPQFVIEELQHIADSEESIKRIRGRRGLDMLAQMQRDQTIYIDIINDHVPEETEVDMKLLKLCKKFDAPIITNDFNLNKVAKLQGIEVLNINVLVNAVKTVLYPGESFGLYIAKEGKEAGQGIGYLDDGTMVVVEDGRSEIGHTKKVTVTSVFQTAAGRMIFVRLKEVPQEIPMLA